MPDRAQQLADALSGIMRAKALHDSARHIVSRQLGVRVAHSGVSTLSDGSFSRFRNSDGSTEFVWTPRR